MTFFAGIDVGSLSTDVVIIDDAASMMAEAVLPTGISGGKAALDGFQQCLNTAGLSADKIQAITATGYGRSQVDFATRRMTEISCHGQGAHHMFPGTGTVIDIGGQDSKVIQIDGQGRMIDFTMNDKCAAGTGRFLEVMANRLELGLDQLSDPLLVRGAAARISSTCTVFAESEVISLLAQDTPMPHVVNGLQRAIVNRIANMVITLGVRGEITISGGVARNQGLVELLSETLGQPLNVPDSPQIVGALGAALLARQHHTSATHINPKGTIEV